VEAEYGMASEAPATERVGNGWAFPKPPRHTSTPHENLVKSDANSKRTGPFMKFHLTKQNTGKTLFLLILLGLLFRLVLVLSAPPYYTSPEAGENYLVRSQAILDGKVPYRDFWDSKPPLWTYTFALWGKFFGINVFSLKALVILFEMFFIIFLFQFTKYLFGDISLAFITILLYTFLPQVYFVSSVEGKYESLTFIFFIGSIWLILREKYWLAAIIIGIGMGFKYNVALMILPGLLYLAKEYQLPINKLLFFILIPFFVLLLILLPFLILCPEEFVQYTIKNFIYPQEIPQTIEGMYNDTPGYHGISIWGALRYGFHLIVPPFIPYIFQFGLILFISWLYIRKRSSSSNLSIIFYSYVLITAIVVSLQIGHLQYFNWSLPFMVLIFAYVWRNKEKILHAKRYMVIMIFQSFLVLHASNNWMMEGSGPILVLLALSITAYLLIVITKISFNRITVLKEAEC
jgi:hypothetical protein